MTYDPARDRRRSIRLRGYDYTQPGAYFVTLCTYQFQEIFGEVVNGVMILDEYGEVAQREWLASATIRREIELDAFVIMPNHAHGIVWIVPTDDRPTEAHGSMPVNNMDDDPTRAHSRAPLLQNDASRRSLPPGRAPKSLGAMIAGYKSTVTRQINMLRNSPGTPIWQRNYYEHVIRNDRALNAIRAYILDNPQRWTLDRYHPAPAGRDPSDGEVRQLLKG